MKVNDIREDDSKGRHTTTHRQLIMLPGGSMIIDTPGMRELGMWDVRDGISEAFEDIEELTLQCRFSNCTHTNEPGCAILDSLNKGILSYDRYNSYLRLMEDSVPASQIQRERNDKKKNISKAINKMKKEKRIRL